MAPSVDRKRVPLAALLALLLLGAFVALPATAAPVKKLYEPTITPTTIQAGAVQGYTLTLKNSASSTQSFGSANITVPIGFTNISLSPVTTPTGITWSTPVLNTSTSPWTIALRSPGATSTNNIAPGKSISLVITATAPCSTGAKTWNTQVKQSNDFLGSMNDFTVAPSASQPKVTVTGACVGPAANIAFVSGPSDTAAGGTMADVTVKVTDASNNALSGESVTLSSTGLVTSPTSPATTGANGIATFSGLSVGTTPGPYTMTASDGALSTAPASFNITVGAAASITFTKQPKDTLVNTAIDSQAGGGVEVQVKDAFNNPVPGATVSMAISPDSFAFNHVPAPNLTGNTAPVTDATGTTAFTGLTIDLSSSGYKLRASVGSVNQDSSVFAITSTGSGCTNCTATLPNGGTVSAPAGTTLIVENNNVVDCGTSFVGFAGTVTIIPGGSGDITVKFVDPYTPSGEPHPQPGVTYPFCKGGTHGPTILDYGNAADRCDAKPTPCVENQYFEAGSLNLVTLLQMNSDDPPVRH